jgi:hypothetical protein
LGYLTGKVGSPQQCFNWEFHRERFLRRGEQLTVRETAKSAAAAVPAGSPSTNVAPPRAVQVRPQCEAEPEPTWRD